MVTDRDHLRQIVILQQLASSGILEQNIRQMYFKVYLLVRSMYG